MELRRMNNTIIKHNTATGNMRDSSIITPVIGLDIKPLMITPVIGL